jgi:hypothetical protein
LRWRSEEGWFERNRCRGVFIGDEWSIGQEMGG